MNINFDQTVTDLDGKPIREQTINDDGERGPDRDLTLGRVCVNALLTPLKDDKVDGPEHVTRLDLAKRIHDGGEIDLTVEEVVKIKKLIPKVYLSTIIVGETLGLLDPKKEE